MKDNTVKIIAICAVWFAVVCFVISILIGLIGCTAACGNDKTGEYMVVSFLQGTAHGSMDPNSGGTWRRTGPSDLSGVEIVEDKEGYSVTFDQSKSATEWDKAAKMFELGLKVGAGGIVP